VTIWLPPLRERQGDIPLLSDYFLARYAREMEIENPGITEMAKAMLSQHSWPGNVRELANTLQKALIFSRGCPIGTDDIGQAIGEDLFPKNADGTAFSEVIRQWVRKGFQTEKAENLFDTYMDRFASILVSEALSLTGGNRSRAARLLGLSRPTLLAKIDKYRLKVEMSVSSDVES